VPAGEHAASYHLEVVAPPGVRIGEATLLAGPPGGAEREVTIDHLRGSALTVGLHGVDVPRRSLCRAQVHMRVQAAGWLTTTALTTLAIAAALLVLLLYGPGGEAKDVETTLVAGVAAAAATFIVQRDHGTLASRLVMLLRFSAFTATALLVVGVGLVALGGERDVRRMLLVFTVVATALFLHLAAVWFRSWRMDRRRGEPSPWDMVPGPQAPRPGWLRRWWCDLGEAYRQWRVVRRWDRHGLHPPSDHDDLARLVVAHRFDRPAVGIQSAEAWHRRFDRRGREADDRMRENLRRPATACGVPASGSPPCPRPRHRCPGAPPGGATQNGHHAGPHPPSGQNS
jgi:hypothetical protein